MADASSEKLRVNVIVEISATTLQTIVSNAKKTVGMDSNGSYRVDTADKVSEMVSRFLEEKDFHSYVSDIRNFDGGDSGK